MTYKRKEVIGDCTLYLGDCLEVMPLLGKVDAVVTDPPYGINRSGQVETFPKKRKHKRKFHKDNSWDIERPKEEVFSMIREISSTQIIWGGNYFADILPATMGWLYWDKGQKGLTMSDGELAWTSMQKALRSIVCNRGALVGSQHPTQKPLKVMQWCLQQLPKETVTILDPFMGSGTTLVACAKMGRKGIGIELDEDYFNIACKRVKEAYKSPDLFVEYEKKTINKD
jgi:DNA modification methylase